MPCHQLFTKTPGFTLLEQYDLDEGWKAQYLKAFRMFFDSCELLASGYLKFYNLTKEYASDRFRSLLIRRQEEQQVGCH